MLMETMPVGEQDYTGIGQGDKSAFIETISAIKTLNLDRQRLNDSNMTPAETTDRNLPMQDSIFGETIDVGVLAPLQR